MTTGGLQPESEPKGDVTRLLRRHARDPAAAFSAVFPLLQSELRRIAEVRASGGAGAQTLHPTALLHEAFVRLSTGPSSPWRDRQHLLRSAALTMRRLVIDAARRRRRAPLEGGDPDPEGGPVAEFGEEEDLERLESALARLDEARPVLAQVVTLRFFLALSVQQTAAVLELSPRTVDRYWNAARAWLRCELR